MVYTVLKQSYFFDFDQRGRRGHSKKLFIRRSRLDIRKFAFNNRIINRWNLLSESQYSTVVLTVVRVTIAK